MYQIKHNCQIPKLSEIYKTHFSYKTDGIFVEVGAHDGQFVSNTCFLADIGWRGLYVEPVPPLYTKCCKRHAKNKNITCVNKAICDQETIEILYANTLSTTNPYYQEMYKNISWAKGSLTNIKYKVPGIRLSDLLEEQNISKEFDLLVIDVEGSELDVLKTIDLNVWKPKMVIIEIEDEHPSIGGNSSHRQEILDYVKNSADEIRKIMKEYNYKIIYKDHINTIFCKT